MVARRLCQWLRGSAQHDSRQEFLEDRRPAEDAKVTPGTGEPEKLPLQPEPPPRPKRPACAMHEHCLAFESPPDTALQWVWCRHCPAGSCCFHSQCWKMGHHLLVGHECEEWFSEDPGEAVHNFGHLGVQVQSDAVGTVSVVGSGMDAYDQWAKGAISFQDFAATTSTAIFRSLGSAGSAFGGAAAGAAVGTCVCPGVGTALGTVVGSFFCSLAGSWLAGYLAGNMLDWLFLDETQLHIDTVLLAMSTLGMERQDPYVITLANVDRSWRLAAREVHPDRCHRREAETKDEYQSRMDECTQSFQRLVHHYRVLVAFIQNRESENWQRLREQLESAWTDRVGEKQQLALCA